MFSLLDDESKLQTGTDQLFVEKLIKNFSQRAEFKTPKGQSLEFMIQHFAGQASTVVLLVVVKLFYDAHHYNTVATGQCVQAKQVVI